MNRKKLRRLGTEIFMLIIIFMTGYYRFDAYAAAADAADASPALDLGGTEPSESEGEGTKEDPFDFEGEGTKEDPYLISSVDDLKRLRNNVDRGVTYEECYFAQTEDLFFSREENWEPIGDVPDKYAFAGCYDGRGHVMHQLHCVNKHAGLFALLSGEVRNLGIESGSFRGECIGSITSHGIGSPKIINCYNKASVRGRGRAGGITDNFSGLVLFCWNLGKVSGEKKGTVTAGITSYGTASIEYCYTTQTEHLTDAAVFLGTVTESGMIEKDGMDDALLDTYLAVIRYPDTSLVSKENLVFLTAQDGNLAFLKNRIPDAYKQAVAKGYTVEIFLAAAAVFFLILLGISSGKKPESQKSAAVIKAEDDLC